MTTTTNNFNLRLQASVMKELRKLVAEEGTTLNQFINVAVAEKLSALRTEQYFAERAARGDREALSRLLARAGNEPPREGDELPEGW